MNYCFNVTIQRTDLVSITGSALSITCEWERTVWLKRIQKILKLILSCSGTENPLTNWAS